MCLKKKTIQNNLTWLACAREAIDHIPTYPIIHAWVTLTVIHISLAVCAHVAWKTEVFFFLELFLLLLNLFLTWSTGMSVQANMVRT